MRRFLFQCSITLSVNSADGVIAVRQSRLENLRAKNYRGSEEEWAQILSHVLGQDSPSTSHASWSSGVEVTASIQGPADEDKEMVIALRKRIDTITVCPSRMHQQRILSHDFFAAKAWLHHTQAG